MFSRLKEVWTFFQHKSILSSSFSSLGKRYLFKTRLDQNFRVKDAGELFPLFKVLQTSSDIFTQKTATTTRLKKVMAVQTIVFVK